MRVARLIVAVGLLAAAAIAAGSAQALADSTTSSNWGGYAAHRSGVRFRTVLGIWRQPVLSCAPGHASYSSVWVGLGGYSETSQAVEQTGTEADCSTSGGELSSGWYELDPAPSNTAPLRVQPGDLIAGAVSVSGNRVKFTLSDLTTHRSFSKTVRASTLDVTSADWIVEAPSECGNSCTTLPLADFRSVPFADATARTTTGRRGTISSGPWSATKIILTQTGRRFVLSGGGRSYYGGALPSQLRARGSAFTISYRLVAVGQAAAADPLAATRGGAHPRS